MKELKINLKELEEDKRKNFEDRLRFIEKWAEYVRTHPDRDWSEQQRLLIDSQLQSAKSYPLTKEQYLKSKSLRKRG